MTPTDVSNLALAEGATRTLIQGFPPIDNTPAAVACNLFYTPKTRSLLRGANWAFCRRQALLTLLRRAVESDGTVSTDPPSQPWQYEYLAPSDSLRMRFIQQYLTTTASGSSVPLTTAGTGTIYPAYAVTNIPFVEAVDLSTGSPRKTILTNMPDAMLIYTADLSQYPDMWDPLFLTAETAYLAGFLIANLSGDRSLMVTQIQIAKAALDQARGVDGNERIANVDHLPDWIRARAQGGIAYGSAYNCNRSYGWDAVGMPDGLFY
jgi:hypothetical protein